MNKDGTCPCMDPNALPRRIKVGDSEVGIIGLNEIIAETASLDLVEESEIGEALLERVKRRNWVPDEAEDKYKRALVAEYKAALKNAKQ